MWAFYLGGDAGLYKYLNCLCLFTEGRQNVVGIWKKTRLPYVLGRNKHVIVDWFSLLEKNAQDRRVLSLGIVSIVHFQP